MGGGASPLPRAHLGRYRLGRRKIWRQKGMNAEPDQSSGAEADEPRGWPTWDLEAEKILRGIRHWVQQGGDAVMA